MLTKSDAATKGQTKTLVLLEHTETGIYVHTHTHTHTQNGVTGVIRVYTRSRFNTFYLLSDL